MILVGLLLCGMYKARKSGIVWSPEEVSFYMLADRDTWRLHDMLSRVLSLKRMARTSNQIRKVYNTLYFYTGNCAANYF